MSLASRLASAFPKWGHIFRAAESGATPMPELRRTILDSRAEYWYRKLAGFSGVWQAAKGEFAVGLKKASNPGELHYGDAISAGLIFVQVYGCFKLGEISVRRNVNGYPTPAISNDIFKKF